MTDAQMVTIAIAIIASLGAVTYNNSRITDLRDSVNRHIGDKFNLLVEKLGRMEDNLTRQIADVDVRLQRLEHPSESN